MQRKFHDSFKQNENEKMIFNWLALLGVLFSNR
jgi:hypothetical protein